MSNFIAKVKSIYSVAPNWIADHKHTAFIIGIALVVALILKP